jgi:hypothetical protein
MKNVAKEIIEASNAFSQGQDKYKNMHIEQFCSYLPEEFRELFWDRLHMNGYRKKIASELLNHTKLVIEFNAKFDFKNI